MKNEKFEVPSPARLGLARPGRVKQFCKLFSASVAGCLLREWRGICQSPRASWVLAMPGPMHGQSTELSCLSTGKQGEQK
ncbi:MAG: hypothetical protein B6245_04175 [Desulfobacteraceae bacterium 4572_88]|nr:MAG: hypothetical protein B6245_04175 [Desulfobacteraceae bacterium 4572_88]